MGRYIAQSDVENRIGINNTITYSNLDKNTKVVDVTRVTEAITVAEDGVDDELRGYRYTIPLSGTIPERVKDWCAWRAGIWLYNSRGIRDKDRDNRFSKRETKIQREINKVLAGQIKLNAPLTRTQPFTPQVV